MESTAARTALVVGATGLVGGHVASRLAASAAYRQVVLLVRRLPKAVPDRTATRIVDFDALDPASVERTDDVFCCLGTTIKAAGSQAAFRKVDHDYTVNVASLARATGATRLALVSSVGADPASSTFYLKVKGETERDVEALGFPSLVIARPSGLVGHRDEPRPGERIGIALGRSIAPALLGPLRKYRPIEGQRVAHAMVAAIAEGAPGTRILSYEDLMRLSSVR